VQWRDFLREYAGAEADEVQTGLSEWGEFIGEWGASGTDGDNETARSLARRLLELLRDVLEDDATEVAFDAPATIETRDGSRLAIAPRGGESRDLLDRLDRLRERLGRLGESANASDNLALVVHDDFAIGEGELISGDLALLSGELEIAGEVRGSVLVLDGDVVLHDRALVTGDILLVGGELSLEGALATIRGEVLSDFSASGVEPSASVEKAPEATVVRESSRGGGRSRSVSPFRRIVGNFGHAAEELMGALSAFIALAAIGLLLIYFAQARVETVADTVRHEFARSFAMGLAAEVLFFPALIVLCVLVITWPIVPFFVLGTGVAMLAGYLAVAHGAGEMFAQRRYRYEWLERLRRSNSYYYVLSGLVLLLLPFAATAILWVLGGSAGFVRGIVAFLAAVATWILMTAGFGSLLLTRAGSRSVVVDWSEPGGMRADPLAEDPVAEGPAAEADSEPERGDPDA
jgi:hypothetical protein